MLKSKGHPAGGKDEREKSGRKKIEEKEDGASACCSPEDCCNAGQGRSKEDENQYRRSENRSAPKNGVVQSFSEKRSGPKNGILNFLSTDTSRENGRILLCFSDRQSRQLVGLFVQSKQTRGTDGLTPRMPSREREPRKEEKG